MRGGTIRQVFTFQGTDKEEIVSGGHGEWEEVGDGVGNRPDAGSLREGVGMWRERKGGGRKQLKSKQNKPPKVCRGREVSCRRTGIPGIRCLGSLFCLISQFSGGTMLCSLQSRTQTWNCELVLCAGPGSTPVLRRVHADP